MQYVIIYQKLYNGLNSVCIKWALTDVSHLLYYKNKNILWMAERKQLPTNLSGIIYQVFFGNEVKTN